MNRQAMGVSAFWDWVIGWSKSGRLPLSRSHPRTHLRWKTCPPLLADARFQSLLFTGNYGMPHIPRACTPRSECQRVFDM